MKKTVSILAVMLIMILTAQNGNAQIGHSRSQIYLLASDTFWTWNDTTQAYDTYFSTNNYTYDSLNRILSVVGQNWINGAWENDYQDLYTYGGPNSPVYALTESWSVGVWDTDNLYTNTYDAHNNNLSHLIQGYSGGAFVNQTQEFFTYDSYNNVTSRLIQSWSGSWATIEQDTFINTYDNNNLTQQLQQTYVNGTWEDSIEYTYTYDVNNNEITGIYQIWNSAGSDWIMETKDSFTYDVNNNQTGEIILSSSNGVLTNFVWYIKGYDSNNNKISQIYRSYTNGEWVNGDSAHLYYEEVAAGIQNIADAERDISIYPNPSRSVINIVYNSTNAEPLWATVFDMTGRKLLTQLINNHLSQMNVADLAAGMYQVVFTGANGDRTVKRFVIE